MHTSQLRKSPEGEAKIQRLLSYLGLKSKADLAEFLGKSPQAINSAQARNSIPEPWIDRVAAKRGCSAATLRKFVDTGRPMSQEPDYNNLISSDPQLRELIESWQAFDLQQRKMLQGFTRAVSRGDRLIQEFLTYQVQVIAEIIRYKNQERPMELPVRERA